MKSCLNCTNLARVHYAIDGWAYDCRLHLFPTVWARTVSVDFDMAENCHEYCQWAVVVKS